MARGAWHPRLTTWVDRVDARWQQLGLTPAVRRELRIDLVTDLFQARLAGAPLEELLAVDPDRFAADVAVARGSDSTSANVAVPASSPLTSVRRAWTKDRRGVPVVFVAVAGLLGAMMGGIGGLVVGLPFMGWADQHLQPGSAAQFVMVLGVYVGAALLAALVGGFTAAGACGGSPVSGPIWRRATLGLLASGVVATVLTVSFAAATDDSLTLPVILTEVVLVVGVCLTGLVVVARTAETRDHPGSAGISLH